MGSYQCFWEKWHFRVGFVLQKLLYDKKKWGAHGFDGFGHYASRRNLTTPGKCVVINGNLV